MMELEIGYHSKIGIIAFFSCWVRSNYKNPPWTTDFCSSFFFPSNYAKNHLTKVKNQVTPKPVLQLGTLFVNYRSHLRTVIMSSSRSDGKKKVEEEMKTWDKRIERNEDRYISPYPHLRPLSKMKQTPRDERQREAASGRGKSKEDPRKTGND